MFLLLALYVEEILSEAEPLGRRSSRQRATSESKMSLTDGPETQPASMILSIKQKKSATARERIRSRQKNKQEFNAHRSSGEIPPQLSRADRPVLPRLDLSYTQNILNSPGKAEQQMLQTDGQKAISDSSLPRPLVRLTASMRQRSLSTGDMENGAAKRERDKTRHQKRQEFEARIPKKMKLVKKITLFQKLTSGNKCWPSSTDVHMRRNKLKWYVFDLTTTGIIFICNTICTQPY